MHAADNSPNGFAYDVADQLRHDLKTPLTTIHARAQLLERTIRRSSALADEERAQLLDGVAAIAAEVRHMIPVIDAVGRESRDRSHHGSAPDRGGC